jgi:anti-sigma regulatory factor (Ser/Thr protein kinase)
MAQFSERVGAFLEENGVPPKTVYAVQLILEELITNVIRHAHDDCEVHDIGLRVAIETKQAVVEIEDDGRPFDPLAAPEADLHAPIQDRPIGRLGLHLVRRMADHMDYSRNGGRNRVRVQIRY